MQFEGQLLLAASAPAAVEVAHEPWEFPNQKLRPVLRKICAQIDMTPRNIRQKGVVIVGVQCKRVVGTTLMYAPTDAHLAWKILKRYEDDGGWEHSREILRNDRKQRLMR